MLHGRQARRLHPTVPVACSPTAVHIVHAGHHYATRIAGVRASNSIHGTNKPRSSPSPCPSSCIERRAEQALRTHYCDDGAQIPPMLSAGGRGRRVDAMPNPIVVDAMQPPSSSHRLLFATIVGTPPTGAPTCQALHSPEDTILGRRQLPPRSPPSRRPRASLRHTASTSLLTIIPRW